MERITFERQPWGKHEWQINNPNRLAREVLDDLLERGENDGRFMERRGEAILGRFPGDLELIHSVAVAKWQLGKAAQAAALWSRAWDRLREPTEAMLEQDAKAKVSYSSLENRRSTGSCTATSRRLVRKSLGRSLKRLSICAASHSNSVATATVWAFGCCKWATWLMTSSGRN
jgi:hypothetical protein